MWGIVLINAAGEPVDQLTVDAPFESLRDLCRRTLTMRQDAAQAQIVSSDGLFEFVYPRRLGGDDAA